MKLELWHGEHNSAIDTPYGAIIYEQRTHKYRSEADYKLLRSEYETYGEAGLRKLFDYLASPHRH